MNERIRQLALQAKDSIPIDAYEPKEWVEKYNEIFAQMIVRECANRVDYWESRQGEHTEDLLKHFGVTK
jgi:hypothetical protein